MHVRRLPCPPLAEYMGARVGAPVHLVVDGVRVPGWLARVLGGMATTRDAVSARSFVRVVELSRPGLAPGLIVDVPPRALVLELALPRSRPIRSLLGLEDDVSDPRLGQVRALAWWRRGASEIEQWTTSEGGPCLVTRVRCM